MRGDSDKKKKKERRDETFKIKSREIGERENFNNKLWEKFKGRKKYLRDKRVKQKEKKYLVHLCGY